MMQESKKKATKQFVSDADTYGRCALVFGFVMCNNTVHFTWTFCLSSPHHSLRCFCSFFKPFFCCCCWLFLYLLNDDIISSAFCVLLILISERKKDIMRWMRIFVFVRTSYHLNCIICSPVTTAKKKKYRTES